MSTALRDRIEEFRQQTLPCESILQKLNKHLPNAGGIVLNRMNTLQEKGISDKKLVQAFKSSAFLDVLTETFSLKHFSFSKEGIKITDYYRNDYNKCVDTGNRMRRVIREIMAENKISSSDLVLTKDEKNNLYNDVSYSRPTRHLNR